MSFNRLLIYVTEGTASLLRPADEANFNFELVGAFRSQNRPQEISLLQLKSRGARQVDTFLMLSDRPAVFKMYDTFKASHIILKVFMSQESVRYIQNLKFSFSFKQLAFCFWKRFPLSILI